MRRNRSYQREGDKSPIENLYWCKKMRRLYVGVHMCGGNMMWGFEWYNYSRGEITPYSQMEENLVSIYDVMSTFGCEDALREAEMFGSIADLYLSEIYDNFQLAVQILEGAVEKFVREK